MASTLAPATSESSFSTKPSPDRPSPVLLDPDSPVFIWSRHASIRSTTKSIRSNMVIREYHISEPDTLCVVPASMRYMCVIFTFLLIASLIFAIFNSLLGNSRGSSSYCKLPEQSFSPQALCQSETMFYYYTCCTPISEPDTIKCCQRIRVWLLLALICAAGSTVLGISYTFFHYCLCCWRAAVPKSHTYHL